MSEPKPMLHKRRTYFIEKSFQAKFIVKFCLLVAAAGALTIAILYLFSWNSTTVSVVDSRVVVKTTADFIMPVLIQTVVIVMVIVSIASVFVTLFVSHKIAGPLYRFKKVMKEIEEGDISKDFQLRRLDQLQDLAGAFNNMVAKIRVELKELKHNSAFLKERLDNISEQEVAENKRLYLKELKNISAELDKIANRFKVI